MFKNFFFLILLILSKSLGASDFGLLLAASNDERGEEITDVSVLNDINFWKNTMNWGDDITDELSSDGKGSPWYIGNGLPIQRKGQDEFKYLFSGDLSAMGYYANWRQYRTDAENGYYVPANIPWESLDYVFYAFGDIRAYTDSVYDVDASGELIRLLEKYQGNRCKSIEKVIWENQSYFNTNTNDRVLAAIKGFSLMPGLDAVNYPNETWGTNDIYDFLELAEQHNVKPIISVGGWSFNDVNANYNGNHIPRDNSLANIDGATGHQTAWIFTYMCSSSAFRQSFVSSVARFIDTVKTATGYGFCGIDFDWEYPGLSENNKNYDGSESQNNDKQNFALLLSELREALPEIVISVAVPNDPDNNGTGFDWLQITEEVNWLNIMGYDYYGFAGESKLLANSPLYSRDSDDLSVDKTVRKYLDYGVLPEKISLGIAAYGRGWQNLSGDYSLGDVTSNLTACDAGLIGQESGFLSYQTIYNRIENNNYTDFWDETSCTNYARGGQNNDFITYDSPQAILKKTNYARIKGLKGCYIWSLNDDTYQDETSILTKTMSDDLKK